MAKKCPAWERGSIARPRSHQTRVCRCGVNHEAWYLKPLFPSSRPDLQLSTPSRSFEVAVHCASVRGDSVKAPGPFGGAVTKTLRCGKLYTADVAARCACRGRRGNCSRAPRGIPRSNKAFVDNAKGHGREPCPNRRDSIRSRGSNRAEAPDFAHPNPPPQWK
jgi:hypothetical protein